MLEKIESTVQAAVAKMYQQTMQDGPPPEPEASSPNEEPEVVEAEVKDIE